MNFKKKINSAMEGQLRVWWVPQVGMQNQFNVLVRNIEHAVVILDVLANYDQFQLDNKIKPDYCNAGGLEVFRDGEWVAWELDGFEDPDEYLEHLDESGLLDA